MTDDASVHHLPELIAQQDAVLVELSAKEIESVAGGPQITNDGITPPA